MRPLESNGSVPETATTDEEAEAPLPDLTADVVLVGPDGRKQLELDAKPEDVPENVEGEAPAAPPAPAAPVLAPINRKQLERDTNQLRTQAASVAPVEATVTPFDAHMVCQTPMVFMSRRPAPAPAPVQLPPPPPVLPTGNFAKEAAAASGAVAQQQMWFLQSRQQAPEAKASWGMRQAMRQAGSPSGTSPAKEPGGAAPTP